MLRKLLLVTAIVCVVMIGFTTTAFANNPGTQGQPGQSCQVTTTPPSTQAASARGAPFNPNGVSGGVYANGPGSTPNGNVSNPRAVSQYDVACFQATSHS
jgi:hypothetical protein